MVNFSFIKTQKYVIQLHITTFSKGNKILYQVKNACRQHNEGKFVMFPGFREFEFKDMSKGMGEATAGTFHSCDQAEQAGNAYVNSEISEENKG